MNNNSCFLTSRAMFFYSLKKREKEFYKKSNFKISNTEKKVFNYTSNFKNASKDLAENKKHLIMTAIENSFVNKSSIGMKKSGTENQFNNIENLIKITFVFQN